MNFQVGVDTVDILDDRKQARWRSVYIVIVKRCVTAGIVEAVSCVHGLAFAAHVQHEELTIGGEVRSSERNAEVREARGVRPVGRCGRERRTSTGETRDVREGVHRAQKRYAQLKR